MSTPNVEVLGVQATAAPGGIAAHVPGVDVLAFTGTGPGTLPLAILGVVSLVAGFAGTVFGRHRRRAEPAGATGPLRDLSHLASGALR